MAPVTVPPEVTDNVIPTTIGGVATAAFWAAWHFLLRDLITGRRARIKETDWNELCSQVSFLKSQNAAQETKITSLETAMRRKNQNEHALRSAMAQARNHIAKKEYNLADNTLSVAQDMSDTHTEDLRS